MKPPRRQFLHFVAGAGALPALSRVARAQAYPTRPITMIVPYAAGGPIDLVARILAEHMKSALAKPVVIDNVSGASGSIGIGRVARAAADGHTLAFGNWATFVANAAAMTLAYDVLKDFEPVGLIVRQPNLIVANKAVPANSLGEFIAWLQANPDKASQGTGGIGSGGHIAGILLQRMAGVRFQFVTYRGLALAMQDLLGGQIDFMIDVPTNSLPHVRAGTIKAFAVTAASRLPAATNIETVDEAGAPGLHASTWFGLWAPKGTPGSIVATLNAALVGALAEAAVRERLTDLAYDIFPREQQTPQAHAAFHKAETDKWWPLIKSAGIKG